MCSHCPIGSNGQGVLRWNGCRSGIVLYDEKRHIEWHNPYIADMLALDTAVGLRVEEVLPGLNKWETQEDVELEHRGRHYRVRHHQGDRILFFSDITDETLLKKRYEKERPVLGIVMLDNLEELTQGMDDQAQSVLLARIVGVMMKWAKDKGILLRRMAADRFLMLMDQAALEQLEQSRFDILDVVRDMTAKHKIPLTLSIGVGAGSYDWNELDAMAQTSLDMALGRGGDQAAVKVGERLSFYGGRSNAVEKRTRVRARVISHALRELIQESDQVLIMGHKQPDMDAVGAAVGVLKAVKLCGKQGYVVIEGVNKAISRLMKELEQHEDIYKWFIAPEHAVEIMNSRTLVVVVDTHKRSMVPEPKLLERAERIVVVDHHRRGEEFIDEATLVFIEPYASSTCELVAELLQYIQERVSMEPIEATALLAGIAVDTKSFSLRTGARTFEAASFLRRHGADASVVHRLLKEDLQSFVAKAEIIKNAEILYDHVAIAVARPDRTYSQLTIAQTADTLLNIDGVLASFVLCKRPDGKVGISARSLGSINVQVIMEKLGGGGQFSNAAAQWEGTLEEAERELKQILQKMHEEEGLVK